MRTAHKLTIEIDTSNAAFDDHETGETARILRNIARTLTESGPHIFAHSEPRALFEINGNTCGRVTIEPIR